MENIFDPTFVKVLCGLVGVVAYLVREMGKREHMRNQAESERQRERQQMHQQMMAAFKAMDSRQEKLETWATDHERADRLRFRRVERCIQSVLTPEQRHLSGWLM